MERAVKLFKKFAAITAAALLATGCASVETEKWQNCALAGAAIGGVAGGFGDDHDSEDAVLSAIGGAVIGGTICALMAEDDKPAPEPAPVLDTDGDGVLDDADQCPNSAPGAVVNALGCVAPLVLDGVNFHTDSSELTEEAKSVLHRIATAHHTHHSDVDLLISGHTDSRACDAHNQGLSERRAASVRDFMITHDYSWL